MAIIEAWGSSVAKAIEVAPLPVPISTMEGDERGEKILRASSMRVSVSGRGIITDGLTLNDKDQNSFLPIIYETGSPLIRRDIKFCKVSFSCSETVFGNERYNPLRSVLSTWANKISASNRGVGAW